MAQHQSRLKRLWVRSSHRDQRQCTCGAPSQASHSGLEIVESPAECHTLAKVEAHESTNDPNVKKIDPWWEALSSYMDCHLKSDSSIAPTSFRRAFEVLSCSSLCGVDDDPVSWSDADALYASRDVDEAAKGFAGLAGIPNEIKFNQQASVDEKRGKFPEELANLEIPVKRSPLLNVLRNLAWVNKGRRTTNSVTKLYLYVEQPRQLKHTNSIANSTITWSSMDQGHAL